MITFGVVWLNLMTFEYFVFFIKILLAALLLSFFVSKCHPKETSLIARKIFDEEN